MVLTIQNVTGQMGIVTVALPLMIQRPKTLHGQTELDRNQFHKVEGVDHGKIEKSN